MDQDNNEIDPQTFIDEVKALMSAYCHSTDDVRSEFLVEWMRSILAPLIKAKVPEALWLECSLPKMLDETVSEETFHEQYWKEVQQAADAGSIEAKFNLACELDFDDTADESAALFREAALADHAYSQWCHGLNLLIGRGCEKDTAEGIRYVQLAANNKFEGAIQWMADALVQGTYGFEKDEEEAARWKKMLSHKDVIPF